MDRPSDLPLNDARQLLADNLRLLRALAPNARQQDPESIHDLRVATRRLRAVLAELRPHLPKKVHKEFCKLVRGITKGLGAARQLDVTLERLRQLRSPKASLPTLTELDRIETHLRKRREAENEAVVKSADIVESPAFAGLAQQLLKGLPADAVAGPKNARSRMLGRLRDLTALRRRWIQSRDEQDLHQVRIAFKKFRYTCEIYAPLYGHPMDKFLDRIRKEQSALGDWNDYRALRDSAREALLPNTATSAAHKLCVSLERATANLEKKMVKQTDKFFSKDTRKKFHNLLQKPNRPPRSTRVKPPAQKA